MNQQRPLLYLLPILWQNRKTILWVTLISGLLTALVMWLKPNYYASRALFYPVNNALLSPIVDLRDHSQGYYGNDKDVDRLLSIATSIHLETFILEKFNLAEHYRLPFDTAIEKHRVYEKFRKLYSIRKTPYDAIEVIVEDTDRSMARDITSGIVQRIQEQASVIVKTSQATMLETMSSDLQVKTTRASILTDSIKKIRQLYRIYDTNAQAEALATMQIEHQGSSQVSSMIADYNKGIDDIRRLQIVLDEMNRSIIHQQIELNKVQTSYESDYGGIHIIEEAVLPLQKSRPRRSLYILGAMVLMGGMTCIYILMREQMQIYLSDSHPQS